MNCIFCRNSSLNSKSEEHIIPQSLGNSLHTLPKGIVCDTCNNYFSRKVEKPVLEHVFFRTLRSEQQIMSKKNRPSQIPIYLPEIDIRTEAAFHIPEYKSAMSVHFSDERHFRVIAEAASREKSMRMLFPLNSGLPPYGLMDRLLAKMALEALAHRILSFEYEANITGGIKEVVLDTQLDELRNFARTGMKPKSWPYHQRRIYDVNHKVIGDSGEHAQVLHEFDFLVTDQSEYFFVIAIFGIEFTINLGGPEIYGYEKWLSENHNKSPLYAEKKVPKFLLE